MLLPVVARWLIVLQPGRSWAKAMSMMVSFGTSFRLGGGHVYGANKLFLKKKKKKNGVNKCA